MTKSRRILGAAPLISILAFARTAEALKTTAEEGVTASSSRQSKVVKLEDSDAVKPKIIKTLSFGLF